MTYKVGMIVLALYLLSSGVINGQTTENGTPIKNIGGDSKFMKWVLLGPFPNEPLEKPLPDDDRIIWPDNDKFFQILRDLLNRLDKPISI